MTTVPLRIRLRDDAHDDLSSVEIGAREYGTQLLADLAIPASIAVSVEVPGNDAPPAGCFSFAIGEQSAIVDYVMKGSVEARVPLSLYRHRRLFVNDDVVEAQVAALWPGAASSERVRSSLRSLMLGCIDRNVSLRRLRDALPRDIDAEWNAWKLLCRIHSDEHVAIAVRYAAPDPSLSWTAMQETIFSASGLLCPIPVAEDNGGLPRDEYQIRINDVHLPVQVASADTPLQDALIEFVANSILATPLAFVTTHSIRQRMTLLAQTAPVLADEVVSRMPIDQLCAEVASRAAKQVSTADFLTLLDSFSLSIARYASEDLSLP